MVEEEPISPSHLAIIFSSLLLPPSQTFVKGLGEQLQKFQPLYVGCRLTPGLSLPPQLVLVVNRGGLKGVVREIGFKLWGFAPDIEQKLRSLNPALINAQFGLSGTLALPLAKRLQIPLIVHFRGADATIKADAVRYASLSHWLFFRRMKTLQREATLFIAVSEFIKRKLLESGFPEAKAIVHYEGIDLEQFKPDPTIIREPIVLFVGRLTEKKGCEDLIEAMQKVQLSLPNVKLVIIGDGLLGAQIKEKAKQKLKKHDFLGFQPPEVVKKWMNKAYILAAPSLTAANGDSEGLPMTIVEAQAMGLPVVSTLHAGIPEAVKEGETGFLVPEGDWEQLADRIEKIFLNPQLWHQLSDRAQLLVRERFDRRKQSQKLEEIYLKVLSRSDRLE